MFLHHLASTLQGGCDCLKFGICPNVTGYGEVTKSRSGIVLGCDFGWH